MPIQAVIFDMDGVLIDSEPFWRNTEIEIFQTLGIFLTDEMCASTAGMPIRAVVKHWYNKTPWDTSRIDIPTLADTITEEVANKVRKQGTALAGVVRTLQLLQNNGIRIALASSSDHYLIHTVIDRLDIRSFFEVVSSGQDVQHGKPHPSIFMLTADLLKIPYTDCCVIEDSINGVIAAKAASMRCIAVPQEEHCYNIEKFAIANSRILNLEHFSMQLLD